VCTLAVLAIAITACSGSSDSGCSGLSACCATLIGPEAEACSDALAASQGVDEDCSDVLSGYQSSGVCAGGGGASGCSGLSACCPDLPVMENPSECYTVANNGTDEACNESLQTYRESGYCGSSDSGVLVVVPPPASDGSLGGDGGPPGFPNKFTSCEVPASCEGKVYVIVSALECAPTCIPGDPDIAYALCDGSHYTRCECNIPLDYDELDGGFDASSCLSLIDDGG
jgi:hypothetical protein